MPEFKRGPWSLDWEHQGEGRGGDYDESDPSDAPLLRADLYYDGKPCSDGSYCTLAPDGTDEAVLKRFSHDLFDALGDDPDIDRETVAEDRFDEVKFNDRIMQEWTWRTDPKKEASRA